MLSPQGLHNGPIWTFAGSFFVGDRQSLDEFKKESWDVLLKCVEEGRLTWELNIWHEVYQKAKWSHIFCHATDHTLTPMTACLDAISQRMIFHTIHGKKSDQPSPDECGHVRRLAT